jgi:hypothetical protein
VAEPAVERAPEVREAAAVDLEAVADLDAVADFEDLEAVEPERLVPEVERLLLDFMGG